MSQLNTKLAEEAHQTLRQSNFPRKSNSKLPRSGKLRQIDEFTRVEAAWINAWICHGNIAPSISILIKLFLLTPIDQLDFIG